MQPSRSVYLGTFFVAAGFLFMEILATRVIGFVVGMESVYSTIAVAMLGVGFAGSVVSLMRRRLSPIKATQYAAWLCIGASLGALLIFGAGRLWQDSVNASLDSILQTSTQEGFMAAVVYNARSGAKVLGLPMAASYFMFGAALAVIFRSFPGESLHLLYASDLAGACAGALLAIGLLEYWNFALPLAVAVSLPLIAAALLFSSSSSRRAIGTLIIAAAICGILSVGMISSVFEPRPHLPTIGRAWPGGQYDGAKVEELWHTWTSYGRIGVSKASKPGLRQISDERYFVTHGNGEGHALILNARNPLEDYEMPVAVALATPPAKRVLVLLAGVGRDMIVARKLAGNTIERLEGVELVPQSFDWPLAHESEFHLNEFFADPKVRMNVAEAREYLARDSGRYDTILMSWFGHSLSFYTGMAAGSVNYLYTVEGMKTIVDHLTPDGQLTILNGNKLRVISAIREAFGSEAAGDKFVLIGQQQSGIPWSAFHDERWLVYRPAGFSEQDIQKIRGAVTSPRFLEYFPGMEPVAGNAYQAYFGSPDPAATLQMMADEAGINITPATDDWPFFDSFLPRWAVFTPEFYRAPRDRQWRYWSDVVKDTVRFAAISALIILLPLVFSRQRRFVSMEALGHLSFFALLGAGFMLVEMGLVQKLRLLVGHPGYTIAVVLASLILFAGIGSALSGRLFGSGLLTFRRAAVVAALAIGLAVIGIELIVPSVVGLPRIAKLVVAFFLPALPGLALGQLYPQGLTRISRTAEGLIPWAMAVNATTGTIAAAAGVVLGYLVGFRGVMLIGAFLYLVLALMPNRFRGQVTEPEPAHSSPATAEG